MALLRSAKMATSNISETVESLETQAASSSSQHATASSPPSLLSKLRAPTQSDLMRKQVRTNEPPHTGACKKKPTCSTDPKGVSAAQRAKEFSGEMITVSAGKLFCSACWEELSLKHSTIKGHVQSAKHAQHKKWLAEKRSRERDVSQALKTYEQEVHPQGETYSEAHKLWRVKVVTTFMRAAGPEEGKVEWSGQLDSVPYIEYARSSRGVWGHAPP